MNNKSIYDVWAGDDLWARWTKPALFAQIDDDPGRADVAPGNEYRRPLLPWSDVDVSWAPGAGTGSFVVVDVEGATSIGMGFSLMSCGYRPIVAINACTGPGEVIDMRPVIEALRAGASFPHAFSREKEASPAFLLDARRAHASRRLVPGAFDNRWMVFREDLPSAAFLRERGLSRVVVALSGEALAEDLRHVLYAWQQGGVEIFVKDTSRAVPAERVTIESPPWLRRILGRPPGADELMRNAQGSFGARIPKPSHG
jgi:hypothetical protein